MKGKREKKIHNVKKQELFNSLREKINKTFNWQERKKKEITCHIVDFAVTADPTKKKETKSWTNTWILSEKWKSCRTWKWQLYQSLLGHLEQSLITWKRDAMNRRSEKESKPSWRQDCENQLRYLEKSLRPTVTQNPVKTMRGNLYEKLQ